MSMRKILPQILIVAAGLSVHVGAHADNCTGRVTNVTISVDTVEVGEGQSITIFVAHSITTSEDSPNNAVGKCGGYEITTPGGKTRLVGVCARKTIDGDSWSEEWILEPGAERGTWKQSAGTGVFAGKNRSGWWQPIYDDGKVFMGMWGGNCE